MRIAHCDGLKIRRYAPPRRITRYAVNRRVDAWIDSLPDWQPPYVSACNLVHVAAPDVVKTIERTKRPRVERQGKRAARSSPAQEHVNVFPYDRVLVPGPARMITGGYDKQTARTMRLARANLSKTQTFTMPWERLQGFCPAVSRSVPIVTLPVTLTR